MGKKKYVPYDPPILCASESGRRYVSGRRSLVTRETGTFSLSSTWKNASRSVDASPVGTYKGGNMRLEVTSSSGPSVSMYLVEMRLK